MWSIVEIVVPVFSLILIGWGSVRFGYIGAATGQALAQFAFKIAMPALLFRTTLSAGTWSGDPLLLAAAYFGGVAVIWILASVATGVLLGRPSSDGTAVAMGSCFGNTVMLGIPVSLTAFGEAAAAPIALIITLDSPLLWLMATMQMEIVRTRTSGQGLKISAIAGVARDVVLNPIVLPLILGTIGREAGLSLPPLVDKPLALLQQAAVPAALVALGTSLVAFEMKGQRPTIGLMLLLKMILFPIIVFTLATFAGLPPAWIGTATLLAAMPVGANAYLFASRYETAVGSVSAAVAISTACAVVTISVVLFVLKHGAL